MKEQEISGAERIDPYIQTFLEVKLQQLKKEIDTERRHTATQRVQVTIGILAFLGAVLATVFAFTYGALETSISKVVVEELKETWLKTQTVQSENTIKQNELLMRETIQNISGATNKRIINIEQKIAELPINIESNVRSTLFGELESDLNNIKLELGRIQRHAALSNLIDKTNENNIVSSQIDNLWTRFFSFVGNEQDRVFMEQQYNYESLVERVSRFLFIGNKDEELRLLFMVAEDAIIESPEAIDAYINLYGRRLLSQPLVDHWSKEVLRDLFTLGSAARDKNFPEYAIPVEMLVFSSQKESGWRQKVRRLFEEAGNLNPRTGDQERAFLLQRLLRYSDPPALADNYGRAERVIARRGQEFLTSFHNEVSHLLCIGGTRGYFLAQIEASRERGIQEKGVEMLDNLECGT